ncbi:MAG: recombinase family protein [Candidatus Gracilibacteria bacterium]|nr:recombinase family protein [Candidatus Gracilibacteria bacterium]
MKKKITKKSKKLPISNNEEKINKDLENEILDENGETFEFSNIMKFKLYNEIILDEDLKNELRKNQEIVGGLTYFVYIRVSKIGEYDMSLVDQLKIIIGNANRNGHRVVIRGESRSGSKDGRTEFNLMVKTLLEDSKLEKKNSKYGGVYVFKIDRFARNSKDFAIGEELLQNGKKIISITETIENTPTGRLLFRMLSSFAIFESEKLSNRQSLSDIQNLARKNLRGLGGELDIFGYYFDDNGNKKARSEDKVIKIDKEEKLVVQRIYDIYLDISDKSSKNYVETDVTRWKIIWELLKDKEKLIIKKHNLESVDLKDKEKLLKAAKKDLNSIRNIIVNDNSLKYNGIFERNINVNDELIVSYIKNNSNKDGLEFDIEGLNEVGASVIFRFKFDDLVIIPDEKYDKTRKITKVYGKIPKKIGKYSDILKYETNSGEIYNLAANTVGKKIAIQYWLDKNRNIDGLKCNISQNKIDKKLLENKKFKSLKFTNEQIETLRTEGLKTIKSYNRNILRSLKIKKVVYERMIEDYKYMQDFATYDSYNQNLINKQIKLQTELLKEINDEIYEVEELTNKFFDIYMGIYKDVKKIILDKDSELVNAKLKILIDSIYLDEEINIKNIEYNNFIKKILWPPKEENM